MLRKARRRGALRALLAICSALQSGRRRAPTLIAQLSMIFWPARRAGDDKEEAAIVPVPSATETAPRAPSGSLLDSLFSSSGAAADQRRKATPATPSRGTSSPSPPTRQILQQSAGSRVPQSSAVPLPSAGGGAVATDAVAAATNAPSSASVTLLQAELDQLRREVSNLRYERSEDQKTVGELRRRLDAALEDHKRTTERLAEQHKLEMNELERRHERALDEAKREGDRAAQILSNVREQEGSFGNLATRMDTLNFTLAQLRESVQSIGGRGEAMEANMNTFAGDLRATLNCQQSEQWKRLETDRQQFRHIFPRKN
uniref:Uncharacterized protein n=1 Tax=Globodera pallida TaxID=36090 RepID=A0A183C499_GLOPA